VVVIAILQFQFLYNPHRSGYNRRMLVMKCEKAYAYQFYKLPTWFPN
jgi:hypothetical protein